MNFTYKEDEKYFTDLLCEEDDVKIDKYKNLFDFSDPNLKRKEFNKIRSRVIKLLIKAYGQKCMLNIIPKCRIDKNLVIDHFIPLSSNKLNKTLRKLKPKKGKKVATQSFGSNHLDNLILACDKCNNFKKHKIPSRDLWMKIKNNRI